MKKFGHPSGGTSYFADRRFWPTVEVVLWDGKLPAPAPYAYTYISRYVVKSGRASALLGVTRARAKSRQSLQNYKTTLVVT